ncbi:MAG: histidine phosphatase family protein [Acetatifactor sp.]
MKIYLMRHGETDWNKVRRLQGQSEVPLNEHGVELAKKTAEGLKAVRFDAIFSSPLQRALVTAEIMAGDRPVTVVTDDRLKEMNFGIYEGQSFETPEQAARHPLRQPEKYVPMGGGETIAEVKERTYDFLREKILPLENSCSNVLIVAHGVVNRCMLNRIADIPDRDFWQIQLPSCAVSVLSLEDGKFSIIEQSRVYYGEPVNGSPM